MRGGIFFFILILFSFHFAFAKVCTSLFSEERISYENLEETFHKNLSKLNKKEKELIEQNYEALFFISYRHYLPELFKALLGEKGFRKVSLHKIYDSFREKAFRSNSEALSYLLQYNPQLKADLLLKIHERAMAGGIEGLAKNLLGKYRSYDLYGREYQASFRIEPVEKNPYLTYEKTNAHVDIHYTSPHSISGKALERLKTADPKVYERVVEFQNKKPDPNEAAPEKLVQDMVKALVNERMDWFIRERDQLGSLRGEKEAKEYADLVALLHRDLISIHPFSDGNGRTLRLFSNYLLRKEGLPPVRLQDPNMDINATKSEWLQAFREGMQNTKDLIQDLSYRLEEGLPLKNSPYLYHTTITKNFELSRKKDGRKTVDEAYESIDISPRQFLAYLQARLKNEPGLKKEILEDPVEQIKKVEKEYQEFILAHNLWFQNSKGKKELIWARFADLDFMAFFTKKKFTEKEIWQKWVERYYPGREIDWRGLAGWKGHGKFSLEEALSMFSEPTMNVASNRIGGYYYPSKFFKESFKDFQTYNRELLEGSFWKMADEHQHAKGRYDKSYLYSSGNETTAKRFARGFMVVVDPKKGDYKDAKYQEQLDYRVSVGFYRSEKSSRLGRLRQIFSEFRNAYPRQKEVVGPGIVDPNVVMVVHVYNAQGKVVKSFVRNAEKPNEVWEVKGAFYPGKGEPKKEKLIDSHELKA